MNKHFHDALYYLKRAGEHAKLGVEEAVEPVTDRVRELIGREPEPEASRVDELLEDVRDVERKAEDEARGRFERARGRLEGYRSAK